MDVRDKVVILTGASEGIGEATARLLAQAGARVALVARSSEKLARLAAELPAAFPYTADLRDMGAARGMVEAVAARLGRIDVLINNAGRGLHGTPVAQIPLDEFRELIELNVMAPLVAMQAAVPLMRQAGGGLIINISSRLSKMYVPMVGAYASTKYMLNALTLTAREELAQDNIRVSLVLPGRTATRFQLNSMRASPNGQPQGDSVEKVAATILRAIQTEEAEVNVE